MNNNFSIAKLALPLPIDKLFDYYIPSKLRKKIKTGMRIKVLFNNKIIFGFVIELSSHSKIKKLNPIIETLDESPLLTSMNLELAEKMRDYHICSLGEAIACMLPHHFKKMQKITLNHHLSNDHPKTKDNKLVYIQNFSEDMTYVYYKEEIAKRIRDKKRIIFLVPEIQMIDRIRKRLLEAANINIAIWHGKLSKREVLNLWHNLSCDKIDVIIGTRSAIFIPIKNLDLVIIENEGDYAYKDDQVPYYNALEVAKMRSEIEGCDIIFSSVIPSSQIYKLIIDKKVIFINIGEKNDLAKIQLARINYKEKINLITENEIASALEKKEKILIFLNRKGFATFVYCRSCKDTLKCSRCSNNLRFDYSQKKLVCPSCNLMTEMLEVCPKCNRAYVRYGGLGIEKLESDLKRVFPQAKIVKFDDLFNNNIDYDMVIATQKIMNFTYSRPDITIVWNLDNMLNVGDFNSCEESYRSLARLLTMTKKKMIINTRLNPEFYLLNSLTNLDFEKFHRVEFQTRKELKLPPYYYLALVSIRSLNKENSQKTSLRLFSFFQKLNSKQLITSNLNMNLRSRIREKYYRYLLIKSKNIKLLNNTLKKALKKFRSSSTIITVNINPE